jgi:hypothetical protein
LPHAKGAQKEHCEQEYLILMKYSFFSFFLCSSEETFAKNGLVVHTYNCSTWEVKAGGSQVLGHPVVYSEILFKQTKR